MVRLGVQRGVFVGVADEDHEFAGIDGPVVLRLIPVAEGAGIEREGTRFVSPGARLAFSKSFNSRSGHFVLAEGPSLRA
jgi:hypothetical protein